MDNPPLLGPESTPIGPTGTAPSPTSFDDEEVPSKSSTQPVTTGSLSDPSTARIADDDEETSPGVASSRIAPTATPARPSSEPQHPAPSSTFSSSTQDPPTASATTIMRADDQEGDAMPAPSATSLTSEPKPAANDTAQAFPSVSSSPFPLTNTVSGWSQTQSQSRSSEHSLSEITSDSGSHEASPKPIRSSTPPLTGVSRTSTRSTVIVTATINATSPHLSSPGSQTLNQTSTSLFFKPSLIHTSDTLSAPSEVAVMTSSDTQGETSDSLQPPEVETTTPISNGNTPSGSAAVAGLAAAATGPGDTERQTATSESEVSSFAIVGIVGGVLVLFIAFYILWYQWRKKRRHIGEVAEDRSVADSRSSFGDDPFKDEASPILRYRSRGRHRSQRGRETCYTVYDDLDRYDTFYAHRDIDEGKTPYVLSAYGEGLTAALTSDSETIHQTVDPLGTPLQRPHPKAIKHDIQLASDPPPHTLTSRSFSNGDFYDDYAVDSEPEALTGIGSYSADMRTPATSSLIPWAQKDPIPPVPMMSPALRHLAPVPRRPAPAAVMAQTPMVQHGGWQGVIPGFR